MSTASWFSRALLPWYAEHRRPLPWRLTTDPYRIWLSEVILQQTRVDQGMAYWHRFVDRYPTVQDLAAATEDEVLRLWQGLGYYSRARNLRTAAIQVVRDHGGRFPADHRQLMALKGVGDYTAAAIGSICFGLREPVVDGNVYRVLARVFGIASPIDSTAGRKEFRTLAAQLLPDTHPGDHNQAVMELGAIVCVPRAPACHACPLAAKCVARRTDRIAELPVKAGGTTRRPRHFNYLHIEEKGALYLVKRTGQDIWHGLYELPLLETARPATRASLAKAVKDRFPVVPGSLAQVADHTHLLSHQRIKAVFWKAALDGPPPRDWLRVPKARIGQHALPRLIERYLHG